MVLFKQGTLSQSSSKPQKKDGTILLVDDEEGNLLVLKECLKDKYNVFSATNPEEALEIFRKNPVDLIITDQKMPEMTGVDFLEKTLFISDDCVRIILTGFSDIDAVIKAINKCQVFRYITKPFDNEDIKHTVKTALDKLSERRQFKLMMEDIKIKNDELTNLKDSLKDQIKEKESRYLEILKKFLSPTIVDNIILKDGYNIEPGSKREFITMSNIKFKNFNKLSETITPEDFCEIVNNFFMKIVDIILKYQGTIGAITGDSFFIFFNDPVSQKDHAFRAVKMALEVINETKNSQPEWDEVGCPEPILLSIGINTNHINIGFFGSDKKLEYIPVGHDVNITKALSEINLNENAIIISHKTYRDIKEEVLAEALNDLKIEGINSPIKTFQIKGIK